MPLSRLHFEEELNRVHHDILIMGTRVREDLRKSVAALRERDEELAKAVKADDEVINAMQVKIEDQVAILIATQQPVASDLRELVASIKLLDHLERIGDYAVHLAKAAIKLRDSNWPTQTDILSRMGELGCRMIEMAMDAFLNHDAAKAQECAAMDAEMDNLHRELVMATIAEANSKSSRVDEGMRIIRVSIFLERLGDHVVNLCELVLYMVEGLHAELGD